MIIAKVSKEDAALFEPLDPFRWMSMYTMPNNFAICALDEKENDEKEIMGVLIGEMNTAKIYIEWIGVKEEYSEQGVGEALLKFIFEKAYASGIEKVCAVIDPVYDKADFSASAETYFDDSIFRYRRPLPGHWIGSLEELYGLSSEKFKLYKKNRPVSVSKLFSNDKKKLYNQLDDLKYCAKLYSIKENSKRINEELSYVYMDGDRCRGALLIEEADTCLIPVYFYTTSEKMALRLGTYSLRKATKLYSGKTKVKIFARTELASYITKNIIPDHVDKGVIVSAKPQEYMEWLESEKG